MLLALDPSSSCIGYAVLAGLEPGQLIDAGRIKPSDRAEAIAHLSPVERVWMGQLELHSQRRVESMLPDVAELLGREGLQVIAIEMPSGYIGTGARQGARGALTTYGMATGRVFEYCRQHAGVPTIPVTERQWTRGAGGKDNRAACLRGLYPAFAAAADAGKDKGGDMADAIGLARWAWHRWFSLVATVEQAQAG